MPANPASVSGNVRLAGRWVRGVRRRGRAELDVEAGIGADDDRVVEFVDGHTSASAQRTRQPTGIRIGAALEVNRALVVCGIGE